MPRSPIGASSRPLALVLLLAVSSPTAASDPPASPPPDLAARIRELSDAVLEHHVAPPTRQQMVLAGIRSVCDAAGVPAPAGLAKRASERTTADQLAALVEETWPRAAPKAPPPGEAIVRALSGPAYADVFFEGMLRDVPGASLVSAKEARVAEQFEGNLYVGIHIALGSNQAERRPQVKEVFEGGPADRAGVANGDLIERIDGKDTLDMELREAVDRLRGEEGTEVELRVRSEKAKSSEARTYRVTRGRLPRPTISGVRKRASGGWDVRLDGPDPIGYLRVESIGGSTPHELRQWARQLESEGLRGLVLDLRRTSQAALHPTVLLADELLDGGPIGRVRTTAGQVVKYEASPDALLPGWPLAVLVDAGTRGAAEWLAAALQDRRRAVVVGRPTPGVGGVRTPVPLGDGDRVVMLTTRSLERADGRPIGDLNADTRLVRLQAGSATMPFLEPPGSGRLGVKPDEIVREAARLQPRPVPEKEHADLPEDADVRAALRLLGRAPRSS